MINLTTKPGQESKFATFSNYFEAAQRLGSGYHADVRRLGEIVIKRARHGLYGKAILKTEAELLEELRKYGLAGLVGNVVEEGNDTYLTRAYVNGNVVEGHNIIVPAVYEFARRLGIFDRKHPNFTVADLHAENVVAQPSGELIVIDPIKSRPDVPRRFRELNMLYQAVNKKNPSISEKKLIAAYQKGFTYH